MIIKSSAHPTKTLDGSHTACPKAHQANAKEKEKKNSLPPDTYSSPPPMLRQMPDAKLEWFKRGEQKMGNAKKTPIPPTKENKRKSKAILPPMVPPSPLPCMQQS